MIGVHARVKLLDIILWPLFVDAAQKTVEGILLTHELLDTSHDHSRHMLIVDLILWQECLLNGVCILQIFLDFL